MFFNCKDFLSDLKLEFSGYNAGKLTKDLLAGLTVAAVALPLALAFGVSSGADAASGLITAIIAGIVMSMLAGAFYQVSGPTGAMAAILMSIIAQYQLQGVFFATLMAGVLLLLAGLLHLGKLTSCIPAPVITGFTSGIAIIIALGQVDNFFGVTSKGSNAISRLASYSNLGFSPNWLSIGIGLFVIVFMSLFPKKWNSVVPASLLSIIFATVISALFHLDLGVVGEIPKTLLPQNRLILSSITWEQVNGLIGPAISIALLGMIESLLCGASAGHMTGVKLKNDQELIAQGIGNIIVPFFGGIPATAAIARTSVAIKSGAQTRLTGVFHAVGLLISMFVLAPIMSKIPLSALAGVLMVTAWRMNEWEAIQYIFSRKFKGAILKFTITMIATVLFNLTTAIVIGITTGLILLVVKCCAIEIAVEDVDYSRIDSEPATDHKKWAIVYITGPMFFMTADTIKAKLDELADRDHIVLSLRGVPMADITAVGVMMDYYKSATEQGKSVTFSSIQPAVMEIFTRAGLTDMAGKKSFYFSVDKALNELL